MSKSLEIRNSTAEFLIFQIEGKEDGVQVLYRDETIWCTQKAMSLLFDVGIPAISKHLKNIVESGEVNADSVISKMEITAIDYNQDAPTTRLFFKKVQNKMHYAVHGHTAAELIVNRANAGKEHMGLTSWENAPSGKIVKTDVAIAKNYLKEAELEDMGRLVNGVLDIAERMAKRHIPMTMEDWAKRIDTILQAGGDAVLQSAGNVSAEEAKEFAETEFEKYRIIQDKLFRSDFDKFLGELPINEESF
ncbi:MAG: virulence RhuM family protein [Bacteroidales bacterium]|nr:virulence RhuM family protein [Bacteroidales bacterium]